MGHIRKVVWIDGPLDQPGAGYTQVMRFAGRRLEGRLEVTKAEYLRGREIETTPPLMKHARGRDRLEPRDGGTEVTVELDYEVRGGILGKLIDAVLLRRMMERTFERNGANLKRLVEQRSD